MAVKQYLFRIHHDLITETTRNWINVLNFNIILNLKQCELHHTDFLCSLDETTADLSRQASLLAFAQSVLSLETGIWWITVFELSDDKDADQTTPVIILHGFLTGNRPLPSAEWDEYQRQLPSYDHTGEVDPSDSANQNQLGSPFPGYNLWDRSRNPLPTVSLLDPWFMLSVARDTQRGRHQLQMFRRCLSPEDVFKWRDNSLLLSTRGTLAATRFPIWKAIIESLPHGHSGYSVGINGKLSGQIHALTRRTMNGVSNMAQQRRQFIRRGYAQNVVTREWFTTNKKLRAWFWWNDQYAFQVPEFVQWNPGPPPTDAQFLTATRVPWEYLSSNLGWLVDFLNLVNVAQGDHGLVLTLPGESQEEQEAQYAAVLEQLRDPNGVVQRYALKSVGTHLEVFRHMVDLMAHIIGVILDFRIEQQEFQANYSGATGAQSLLQANIQVDIWNRFALQWPGLVADLYSVYCLLQTWQLTWNVAEQTRGADATDVLRSKKLPYVQKWVAARSSPKPPPILQPPVFNSDTLKKRPQFVPFRMWDVILYDTGFDAQQAEFQNQQRRDAADAWFQEQANARTARELAYKQSQQQYLDQWRAERVRLSLPNPDDLWDYRNYTSWEWWKQKSQEQMNVEFALRAADIPNELLSYADLALGLTRNYVPKYNRWSDENGWNEKNKPGDSPLERIGYSVLTVLERKWINGVPVVVAVKLIGDQAGDLADYLGTNDETYSPREFWPPGSWFNVPW
jgi:hypothetical protein